MISEKVRLTCMRICPLMDARVAGEMESYWSKLAKPAHGLGRMEDMVVHFGLVRGASLPSIQRMGLFLFCGDHGVIEEAISEHAPDYTRNMARTLVRGLAAANSICRRRGIELTAVDMGMRGPKEPGVVDCRIQEGTANIRRGPAMSPAQLNQALETGILLAEDAATRFDVAGLGDVGAGNTTAAAAIVSSLCGLDGSITAGPGSVRSDLGKLRKSAVVRGAVNRNRDAAATPFGALQCLGGFEIAAMAGFLLGASVVRLPVVLDGYTAGAAALAARGLAPDCLDAALFSHLGDDPAHAALLDSLRVTPYLGLNLRMGEGVGAALALSLLDSAVAIYRETGTLTEAGASPAGGGALQ
jgi:nicotinate-nucleotide--dimethylbenzimidazole phosphoribosyltransferase